MPRDVAGNYTLPAGINPVIADTLIDVDWANPTLNDIALQLNNVLTRDGLLGPVSAFKVQDGTVAAPGLSFASQASTGLYRTATEAGFSLAGVRQWFVNASGFNATNLTVTGTLTADSITSGSYTPTYTSISGTLISFVPAVTYWLRIGAQVFVFGGVTCNSTLANVNTEFRMTLPVASNLTLSTQLAGVGGLQSPTTSNYTFTFFGDVGATPRQARVRAYVLTTSTQTIQFSFAYTVI